jgi:hypothetical protein
MLLKENLWITQAIQQLRFGGSQKVLKQNIKNDDSERRECLPKGEVFNVTIIILSSCYWLFRFMIFAPNLKTSGSYTFLLNISLGTLYFSMHLHSQTQKQKAKQERLKEQKTKTKNILDEKNKNFTN